MRDKRTGRLLFVAAAIVLAAYEMWSVFVRETPAVTIQGFHRKAADEFGQGVQVSQAFRMTANGLDAVEVQFSTDQLLTLMVRCELAEISQPRTENERLSSRQFITFKQVSGVDWRRISFPTVEETSDKRWYILRLDLVSAVPAGESGALRPSQPADEKPRVGPIISTDNVFGGGSMWIADRRQLGSLSLRAYTHRRTAYARFRADVAPTLPRVLQNPAVHLGMAVVYQAAMLAMVYALLFGVTSTPTSGARAATD